MENFNKEAYSTKMNDQFHIIGRISLILTLIMLYGVIFFFAHYFNVTVESAPFLRGFFNVAVVFYPVSVVEFLVYAPMLGAGGSYLAFVTGNVTSLKIPCVMNAKDICKVEANTFEAEVVSTISVAASAITTMAIIFIGVLAITPLTPILESTLLAPAFDNVVAALFGALGFKYFFKQPKITVVPLLAMIALCIFVPAMISQVSVLIIPAGVLAMVIGVYLAKNNKIKVD